MEISCKTCKHSVAIDFGNGLTYCCLIARATICEGGRDRLNGLIPKWESWEPLDFITEEEMTIT